MNIYRSVIQQNTNNHWTNLFKAGFCYFFQDVNLASDIKLYLDYLITSFGVKSVIIYSCLQQL